MIKEFFEDYHSLDVLEFPDGFISYKIIEDENVCPDKFCFIYDVYIKKNQRRKGIGTHFAKIIEKKAIDEKCRYLFSMINLPSKNPEISILAQIKFGFKIKSIENNKIVFQKELEGLWDL